MYYTYIIECVDGSLYTGVAVNVDRRIEVHSRKISRSAKYTRSHTFSRLRAVWESSDRSKAQKLEYRIKQLTRHQKLTLIENDLLFPSLIKDLEREEYRRINEKSTVD